MMLEYRRIVRLPVRRPFSITDSNGRRSNLRRIEGDAYRVQLRKTPPVGPQPGKKCDYCLNFLTTAWLRRLPGRCQPLSNYIQLDTSIPRTNLLSEESL